MKPKSLFGKNLRGLSSLALLVVAALLCVATSQAGPPRITEIIPEAGAVDVPVDSEVLIRFDEEVDETTLGEEAVLLEDPDGVRVPSRLALGDSYELVIVPDQNLTPVTTYRVVLDLDLLRTRNDATYEVADESLDLEHDPVENTVSYTFTTGLAIRP